MTRGRRKPRRPGAGEAVRSGAFLNYVAASAMAVRSIAYPPTATTGPSSASLYERLVGMPESGIIASGPIISLMDMATSIAIWVKLGRFRHQATLDMRVDYLRPAVPGHTIIGRGECYAVTKSVGFVRGLAHEGDPENPLAHVSATFMFTD